MKWCLLGFLALSSTVMAEPSNPVLKSVSSDALETALSDVRRVQFEHDHNRSGVAWAFAKGNHCSDREFITRMALALGPEFTFFSEINDSSEQSKLLEKLSHPIIQAAHISLRAPMKLNQKISFSDKTLDFSISWSNHEATVVNENGQLRVVDLTVSDKTLLIDEWISAYYGDNNIHHCGQLTNDEYFKLHRYDICLHNAWIPGSEPQECVPPEKLCGYMFDERPDFDSSKKPGEWGSLASNLSSVLFSLNQDSITLRQAFQSSGVTIDPIWELPFLKSAVVPTENTQW